MINAHPIDDIVVITLAHGKANALDLEFCNALLHEVEATRNTATHGIVLTGTGHIFSAGVDLLRILDEDVAYTQEFLSALELLFETLFTYPKPLVAAVNGHAIAGGCVMASCADVRIMADGNGRVGAPELRVGVPFPTVALEIMRYALPGQRLDRIMFSGETFLPADAKTLGLLDEVVPPDELIPEALKQIKMLTALPTAAFALTKRQLRAPTVARFQNNEFDTYVKNLWQEPSTREAIRRYVEKTMGKK